MSSELIRMRLRLWKGRAIPSEHDDPLYLVALPGLSCGQVGISTYHREAEEDERTRPFHADPQLE
jgi:hypothetical protein